jgi:hypothetical protein
MICGVSLRALLDVLMPRAEMSLTRLFVWEVIFHAIHAGEARFALQNSIANDIPAFYTPRSPRRSRRASAGDQPERVELVTTEQQLKRV